MTTILKRTTAIAALAALPLAPIAVQAQSLTDQAQTTPDTQSATQYGTPGEQPSAGAEGTSEDAGKASDSTGKPTAAGGEPAGSTLQGFDTQDETAADRAQTEPETQDTIPDSAEGEVTPGGESTHAAGAAPTQSDQTQAESTETGKAGGQTQAGSAEPGQPSDQMEAEGAEPDETDEPQQAESAEPGQPADQEQAEGAEADEQQAATGDESDPIVARVGDADIMQSDVLGVIGALPPELQQQPAEMLIPLALEQLVLRELILQKAREAGLESDPDVEALLSGAPDASDEARENAMVQVWLDRELAGAVTDAAVQETYGQIESEFGDQVPPLEQIRPQIEQELRRLAFLELSDELQTDADVTLFGPDGQPIAE